MAEALPKVLLLGDSIRMSYQRYVAELMAGRAEIAGPAENCQFSAHTLAKLDDWLNTLGAPDVVHWNNGLHDCGHNPNRDPVQIPLETYVANLKQILAKLRATGAKVIWATMTPQHPNRAFSKEGWSWRNEEINRYNAAALKVMHDEGVPVNDLHALVWSQYTAYLADDRLHLSEQGQRQCAKAVVAAVEQAV